MRVRGPGDLGRRAGGLPGRDYRADLDKVSQGHVGGLDSRTSGYWSSFLITFPINFRY